MRATPMGAGWWRSMRSKPRTVPRASSAPRDSSGRAACARSWTRSTGWSRGGGRRGRGWAPAAWSAASSDLWPILRTNPRDHAEAHSAIGAHLGPHYRDFAFREIRRAGDGVERVAVAGDDAVFAFRHRRGKKLPQLVVAPRILGLRRAAAHLLHRLRAPKDEPRGFHGAAKGAGEDLADWDGEALQVRTDLACFGAALLGEVTLVRAVLVARHRGVVLAEVGRRVSHVEDQAAFAELRHARRIDLRGGFEGKEKQAAEQCFHHGAFSSKRGTSLAAPHAILTRGARR